MAKPTSFTVIPERVGNTIVLGGVGFRNITVWNGVWAAMAPLGMLPIAWWTGKHLAVPDYQTGEFGWWLLWCFFSANFLFSAIPSGQDFRISAKSILFYSVMAVALWYTSAFWLPYLFAIADFWARV